MRKPLRITLAIVLAAAGIATGCGSDDDQPQSSDSGARAAEKRAQEPVSEAKDEAKPKAKRRAKDGSKRKAKGESKPKAKDESKPKAKPKGNDEAKDEPAAKPKKGSVRAKLVTCIEDADLKVAHKGQDADTATKYTVEGDDGGKRAEIVIYPNGKEAQNAAINDDEDRHLRVVALGRAKYIRYDSSDTEAGAIANCIAEAYVPRVHG